ncbi:uncharacterized protein LOC129906430 [Episyrphus balteatus]|uniref:uncharacterized protein LOC129906430 n=1 Tax=Episyrphus balteatus TaxID=286459 RepID=UPI0024853409|nr:uncharacterized protein LOC129906430 [Episyrphus balteatus]
MSQNSDSSETSIFLDILEKYKFILKRATNSASHLKHKAARNALTKEFNQKCMTKLTVKQILRKINNFKFRLREKNFQGSCKNEKPRFTPMEERFLSLWGGDDEIDLSKKGEKSTSEQSSIRERKYYPKSENSDKSPIHTNIEEITDQIQDPEVILKIERCEPSPDETLEVTEIYHVDKEEPSHSISEISNLNNWDMESDSDSETSFYENDDDPYAQMTLDELKRAVLISQSKMFKAAEASARAKEKLKLFELSLLQRNNGNARRFCF